jgi:hypothetical protein
MSLAIEVINTRDGLERFPKLQDFLVCIHQRPAWQQSIERKMPTNWKADSRRFDIIST